jgi:hypothetical protein
MRLPSLALALALTALACKGEGREAEQPVRLTLAFDDNGKVGECVDYIATPNPGGSAQAIVDSLLASYKKVDVGFVRVEQPCAQHFAGRNPFGACDVRVTNSLGALSGAFVYFEGVTPPAARERDCLKADGAWRLVDG